MPRRPIIRLFRCGDHYAAQFSDPAADDRLSSDTITMPHPADADPLDVLRYAQEHFPEGEVALVLADTPIHATNRTTFRSARSMN